MEYVEAHPDKNWNWGCLSRNPNVTMEYVEAHPDKSWELVWSEPESERDNGVCGSTS